MSVSWTTRPSWYAVNSWHSRLRTIPLPAGGTSPAAPQPGLAVTPSLDATTKAISAAALTGCAPLPPLGASSTTSRVAVHDPQSLYPEHAPASHRVQESAGGDVHFLPDIAAQVVRRQAADRGHRPD